MFLYQLISDNAQDLTAADVSEAENYKVVKFKPNVLFYVLDVCFRPSLFCSKNKDTFPTEKEYEQAGYDPEYMLCYIKLFSPTYGLCGLVTDVNEFIYFEFLA